MKGLMQKPQPQANSQPTMDETQMPPEVEAFYQQGIELLFSERLEKMVNMFEVSGVEGFPDAMATAINTVLEAIEQQQGQPMAPEIAAAVGTRLFLKLLEKLYAFGFLPKLPIEAVGDAFSKALRMYAETHPQSVAPGDVEKLGAMLQQQAGGGDQAAMAAGAM